jgi:DNA-binding CsgD family transcriptional regulator
MLVRVPNSLRELVESSAAPLAVLELPSSEVLAANEAMARAFQVWPKPLVGLTTIELLRPDQRSLAEEALLALSEGVLAGYQAVRRIGQEDNPKEVLALWLTAVDTEEGRVGLLSAVPLTAGSSWFKPIEAMLDGPGPGNVVLGTLDQEWRVDRVSFDVVEMLGYQPGEFAGLPLLGILNPSDVPGFFAAVGHARIGHHTVRVKVGIRTKSGGWEPVTAVLATLSDDFPPPLAFAMVRSDAGTVAGGPPSSGGSPVDAQVLQLTHELRVAGMIHNLDRLPDMTRYPALSRLTAREWQVLLLLIDGQRVPSIAADLYVTQSTVRNHLSSVFSKLGVHSQAELLRQLRPS